MVVLGGSGMLGSMVTDFLATDDDLKVAATVRSTSLAQQCRTRLPKVEWRLLDVATAKDDVLSGVVMGASWIVNAIGLTKPYIHDDNPLEVERAIKVNALFPHELVHAAEKAGASILQIATDCVYSGTRGHYLECDPHDPLDVYGKTKSLGESTSSRMHCLRCSIIGPEPKAYAFLLEWFRRQPPKAHVSGYTNHQWNGITTLHFARLCHGVIKQDLELPRVQHVVPSGTVSKFELLQSFAREYKRQDVTVIPTMARTVLDRTLSTANDSLNRQIWRAAGYSSPPTVQHMVEELAGFDYRMELS